MLGNKLLDRIVWGFGCLTSQKDVHAFVGMGKTKSVASKENRMIKIK
jgi:hypothetical protein